MKNWLFCLFVCFFSSAIFAQEKKAIYVYRNDNVFDAYACSEIQEISYEEDGDNINQIIWTNDSANVIPISKIDSICFDVPQTVIMQIPTKDLNGWEFGCSLGNEYIVASTESSDYPCVIMINKSGEDDKNGLILCFNDENEVISVGNTNYLYDVKYDEEKIILYRFNEEGLLEENAIYFQEPKSSRISTTRALPTNLPLDRIGNCLLRAGDFISNIISGYSIGDDVVRPTMNWNWNWAQVGKLGFDSGLFLVGLKVNPLTGVIITCAQFAIGQAIKQDCERKRLAMYADCDISIDEIRTENEKTVVYATVKNANNLPDYLVNMYDRTLNDKTRNLVSCGIVIRKSNNFVNTHVYDYKSQESQLNNDVQYGSTSYFTFEIPEIDLTNSMSTFYFRPYLTSSRLKTSNGDVSENYIKYGKTVKYTEFPGEIKGFKQNYAKYSTDLDKFGFVMFNTTLNASIDNLDNIEEWGVYVYDLNGSGVYDYYPSENKATKLEDSIYVDFNINKNEFDKLDDEAFLASKKVKIGLYKKIKNPTGVFDYMSYIYSDPEEYELIYNEKPSLKFTKATLGETSVDKDEKGNPNYCHTKLFADYKATGTFWVNTVDLVVIQGTAEDGVGYWDVVNDGEQTFWTYYHYDYGGNNDCAFKFDFVLSNGKRVSSLNVVKVWGSPTITGIDIVNIANSSRSADSSYDNTKKTSKKNNVRPIFTLNPK